MISLSQCHYATIFHDFRFWEISKLGWLNHMKINKMKGLRYWLISRASLCILKGLLQSLRESDFLMTVSLFLMGNLRETTASYLALLILLDTLLSLSNISITNNSSKDCQYKAQFHFSTMGIYYKLKTPATQQTFTGKIWKFLTNKGVEKLLLPIWF